MARLLTTASICLGVAMGCSGRPSISERLVVVSDQSAPLVSLRLIFGIDPASVKPGLAALVATTISGRFSPLADSVVDVLTSAGVNVTVHTEREVLVCDVAFPVAARRQVESALPALFGERLSEGLRIEEVRAEQLIRLERLRHDARRLASSVFWAESMSGGLGIPAEGTDSSIANISQIDVRGFCATTFTAGNYVLGLSGPVDVGQASELDRSLQQSLPGGSRKRHLGRPTAPDGLNVRIVEYAESDTAFIIVGACAPHAIGDTAAWIMALASAQQAVPGASASSLDQVLRAERGIAEEIEFSTGLAISDEDGSFWKADDISGADYFTVSLATSRINAAYTLRVIIKELTDLHTAGLSEDVVLAMQSLIQKHEESRDAEGRMRSVLRRKWLGVDWTSSSDPGESRPVSSVQARHYLRSAFQPQDLWVVVVCPDAQQLSEDVLTGKTVYQYAQWVNRPATRRLDQEYLPFRPFWQSQKIRILKAEELFR